MVTLKEQITEMVDLQPMGETITRFLHRQFVNSDGDTREVVDALHGTWLGHPLHPVFTDITVGAWALGGIMGLLGLPGWPRGWRETAGRLHTLGTISAVPTMITGLVDYSAIKQEAIEQGTLHAATNTLAFFLHLWAWRARWRGKTFRGLLLALLGTGVASFGAWLGGNLVFRLRVGVNHTSGGDTVTEEWISILPDEALSEHQPMRVELQNLPILLYRDNGTIYAIEAVCAHAGGPLEQGSFDGECVTCPWHQSVYNLRDGSVVHGPTAFPQPTYETRTRRGQIEIRAISSANGRQKSL